MAAHTACDCEAHACEARLGHDFNTHQQTYYLFNMATTSSGFTARCCSQWQPQRLTASTHTSMQLSSTDRAALGAALCGASMND